MAATKTTESTTEPDAFVRPQPSNDFNGYINGEWESKTTIPDDQTRWGSFTILREDNLNRCKELCESAPDSLVGRVYSRALNPPTELDPSFKEVVDDIQRRVNDAEGYFKYAARLLSKYGVSATFHICKSEDDKNPNLRVPTLTQHGLGLPDKSYYTDREDLHESYIEYVRDLTKLFGADGIDGKAVFEFEKRIAEKHLDRAQRRDPDVVYNQREWTELSMNGFFAGLDLAALPSGTAMQYAIIDNPALMDHFSAVVQETPVTTLQGHLIFHFASAFAGAATQEIVERQFEFVGKKLQGQKTLDPRWKKALRFVDNMVGDELGKLYVAKHFPAEKAATCNAMVDDLKVALKGTLEKLEWMAAETKTQALRKLDRFGVKIGVPTQWHSIEGLWSELDTSKASLAEFVLKWAEWDWREQEVAKFYTPPERELWHMTPQTVNAYYHPVMNEIVFPAGILQPPFFGFDTYEENVGAIGVVIGHEMTHGFDDQGRKYNADGELKDWWGEGDAKEFDRRAAAVRDHFAEMEVHGKKVNGQLTLGENIADIGGLKLALRALRIHLKCDVIPNDVLDRFFAAYAGMWRMLIRKEMALNLLSIDPHSPCHLRINGALAHIPEFYTTYNVQEGNGMYLPLEKRMNIW